MATDETENSLNLTEKKKLRLTNCLYIVGFLDLFGVSIIIPLLSRHATSLGASPSLVGLIGSVYGGLQFISGPIVGKLSDVLGRRKLLLFCLVLSAVGYAVRGIATNLIILVISRVISGLFKHSSSTAKAYLAEITPKNERPKVFGRFNAISSIGFIIGPVCGGYLADDISGIRRVAFITASLFLINAAVVYFFLEQIEPQGIPHTQSVMKFTADDFSFNPSNFIKSFSHLLKSGSDIFVIRFLLGASVIVLRSNYSLYLEKKFNASPQMTGWLISYGAIVSTTAGFFAGYVAKYYNNLPKLGFHSSLLLVFTLTLMTTSLGLPPFVVGITLLSLATSMIRICMTDLSIQRAGTEETGALLGLSQSTMAFARIISPFLSGVALEITTFGPGIISIFLATGGTFLVWSNIVDKNGTEQEVKKND
ncbi:Major facilitator superfamily domain-containing protein 9 [Holothuria leucospilota]|uniref:Major facilitator superfamily domain-containing protein 9 n=1 Tax=Holothuria leucospilota TaxID=206669 RepID=A0A9Q0YTR8_HOLLE|nr:Major facilitator superfamily domain-containing protein 9 [Holothuria leucospilota]